MQETPSQDQREPQEATASATEGSSTKVVVIEDDQFLREMVVDKLAAEGFAVLGAVDGEQGIELVQNEKPQLILLDIILPGIDGFEVLSRLQADAQTKMVPVIVISNLGSEEDIQKARALGARDYLVKAHFTPAEIVAKVREVIGQSYL